jgi:hypothetical protein
MDSSEVHCGYAIKNNQNGVVEYGHLKNIGKKFNKYFSVVYMVKFEL